MVSIAIPVYNEQENIREVYYQTTIVLSSLNILYEIIFIDDGSKDKTYKILKEIQVQDRHVKIIKFTKNYGQLYAFLAGFEFARGEIIITMDGDSQNASPDIPKFLKKINEGFDFVNGWRHNRNDSVVRKFISYIANRLIRIRTGVYLHDYGCAFIAVRRQIIERLKDYGRDARFIKPLIARLATSVTEVKVRHYLRKSGVSKYSIFKIIKLGLDFLINFSTESKDKDKLPYVIEEVIGD